MPNSFPTAKNNFVTGSGSGLLGTVGHAAAHNALEDKVGIDGSTDVNSLDYKVANRLPLAGGTLTGPVTITTDTDQVNAFLVTKQDTSQLFEVDTLNGWVKVGPDQANYALDPNVSLYITRELDGYSAVNIINPSHGQFASSDLVVVNDTMDAGSGWVDLGINGESWNDPSYATFDAGAGYLYHISNNLYVGSANPGSKLYFFTDGVDNKNLIRGYIDPNGLTLINLTEPVGSTANAVVLYEKDTTDNTATLGLYLEQAVEAIGTFTATHKIKVFINGTAYWLQLDAV